MSVVGVVPLLKMKDEEYEYSAAQFYDFLQGESEEDIRLAELWFEIDKSYAPSPFLKRIKTKRSSGKVLVACDILGESDSISCVESCLDEKSNEKDDGLKEGNKDTRKEDVETSFANKEPSENQETMKPEVCCTPQPPVVNLCRNEAMKESELVSQKVNKSSESKRDACGKNPASYNFAQENHAIKRQKLDGGKAKQILSLKPPQALPHKSNKGTSKDPNSHPVGTNKLQKEERKKVYIREKSATSSPFISTAEMIKKFQENTRDVLLPTSSCIPQSKPKLTLTRPKEPELETSQRVRFTKVKSSAEIEEEMMAKIPKFKARPVNKKILEAPTLVPPQRSTMRPPEFQEFHFETSARATVHSDAGKNPSNEDCNQSKNSKPQLTEPKAPVLQTSMRARPPRMKSSDEVEKEELEKIPKFKAKPLNKKIFDSKGEMGVFCNVKKQVTIPQEFHFAIDERIPPPKVVSDLFDKLSLNSESCQPLPKRTTPNPFHLHTEARGANKEKKFVKEVISKQLEEEILRVPKATPYPYSTDFPVIPPKPEPKPCTVPEPFQLESLVRHEEEVQKELKERERKAREEAERRIFKAQPQLKEDPDPLPEKVRKPLTQIQHFNLHVDQRAPERAEFDQKVKEKEMQYKRYREETEAAMMVEEEKALKQMRRTMIPHAKPVPNFANPFHPQKSSKPTTRAKSPNLELLKRVERRKIASSSRACNMR